MQLPARIIRKQHAYAIFRRSKLLQKGSSRNERSNKLIIIINKYCVNPIGAIVRRFHHFINEAKNQHELNNIKYVKAK